MIINQHKQTTWLHMPKTAGDSFRQIIGSRENHISVWSDPECHYNISEALRSGHLKQPPKTVVICVRDMIDWMCSWTRYRGNTQGYTFDQVQKFLVDGYVADYSDVWSTRLQTFGHNITRGVDSSGVCCWLLRPDQILLLYIKDAIDHGCDVRMIRNNKLAQDTHEIFGGDLNQLQHDFDHTFINRTVHTQHTTRGLFDHDQIQVIHQKNPEWCAMWEFIQSPGNTNSHNQTGTYPGGDITTSQEMMDQVTEYIKRDGTSNVWDGCVKSNNCCKHFMFDHVEQNTDLQQLKSVVLSGQTDESMHGQMLNKTCAQLGVCGGVEGCTMYSNRPKICREFLCDPSYVRSNIYRQITRRPHTAFGNL